MTTAEMIEAIAFAVEQIAGRKNAIKEVTFHRGDEPETTGYLFWESDHEGFLLRPDGLHRVARYPATGIYFVPGGEPITYRGHPVRQISGGPEIAQPEDPYRFPCPKCASPAGEPCTTIGAREPTVRGPHPIRFADPNPAASGPKRFSIGKLLSPGFHFEGSAAVKDGEGECAACVNLRADQAKITESIVDELIAEEQMEGEPFRKG